MRIILTLICMLFSMFVFAQNKLMLKEGAKLTITNGASMTIFGGISGNGYQGIVNNGSIKLKNNNDGNQADWNDLSTLGILTGTGSVIFESSFSQSVSGKTQFYQLEINNNGLELTDGQLIVQNKLILKKGKIGDVNDLVSISNPAASAIEAGSGNADFSKSYIGGSLQRSFSSNIDTYIFPVGGNAQANPLHFVNKNLSGYTQLTAQFSEPKLGSDAGLLVSEAGTFYNAVKSEGVWYLNPTGTGTGGAYDLLLYFNGFTGLADNQFAILRRPDASANAADWSVPAGSSLPDGGSPGRIVVSGYARRNNLTNFSQFGIGVTSVPLPLTLLSFSGSKENNRHLLRWETTDEINTDQFIVERSSVSNSGFIPITSIKANGTVGVRSNYRAYDYTPLQGDNFYRLKMIDQDATFQYSGIILLRRESTDLLTVYPNPVAGSTLQLSYSSSVKGYGVLQITDMSGKVITQRAVSFVTGINLYELPIHVFARGSYRVSLWVNGNQIQTIPFIRQ
jgi:hypothetical protein